jgi:putative intracellular protease/amidase
MKILMVPTSHDQLGNTVRQTGFGLKEFAAPYFVFRYAAICRRNQTPAMARFTRDTPAQQERSQTVKLADMKSENFDTIFYLGGHGPMWDLVDNPDSIALIESFYNSGKPVAAVSHSPGVFHRVMVEGGEEAAVNLTHGLPFLVENELKRKGGIYEKAADWAPFAAVDGPVVTGQNPASSTTAAKALMELLAARKAA